MKIVIGGLIVGILDITYAILFTVLRGGSALRVFQGVASGFFGRKSFSMGMTSVAVGALVHFTIAMSIVVFYWLVSRKFRSMHEHPYLFGAIYGLLVYIFMNFVVIPLSNVPPRPRLMLAVVTGVIVHVVLIGIPAALFSRSAELNASASPQAAH